MSNQERSAPYQSGKKRVVAARKAANSTRLGLCLRLSLRGILEFSPEFSLNFSLVGPDGELGKAEFSGLVF